MDDPVINTDTDHLQLGDDRLAATRGVGLRMSLACPKCGTPGWIQWQNLSHGIHCHACGCQFLVGKHGKLKAFDNIPTVRFTCPRCLQTDEIPAMLAAREVECIACKMPLTPVPKKLAPNPAEPRPKMKRKQPAPKPKFEPPDWVLLVQSHLTTIAVVLFTLLTLGAGVAIAISFVRGGDDGLEGQIRQFTELCLASDWQAAEKMVIDTPVQGSEFVRWRGRALASIQNAHRPRGDEVTLKIENLRQAGETGRFRVTISTHHIGERNHIQIWRQQKRDWQFDASLTMAEEDYAAAEESPAFSLDGRKKAVPGRPSEDTVLPRSLQKQYEPDQTDSLPTRAADGEVPVLPRGMRGIESAPEPSAESSAVDEAEEPVFPRGMRGRVSQPEPTSPERAEESEEEAVMPRGLNSGPVEPRAPTATDRFKKKKADPEDEPVMPRGLKKSRSRGSAKRGQKR